MAMELRAAVRNTNWEALHAEGKTKVQMQTSWVASEERCEVLRRLCKKYKATRVLEVGACCGLASLSMAEMLPEDGQVIALEIDQYLAEFGQHFIGKSEHGKKVKYLVGPAMESLQKIARGCFEGMIKPFDLLLIDADRSGMMDYFNLFWWESPNMLGDRATVCIDITPYKGQSAVLTRGPSVGDLQGDLWVVPSGQDQIDSVRRTLEASTDHSVYQVAGLLVSHSRDGKEDAESESRVSTPRRSHQGTSWTSAGHGGANLTHGAYPLASFPNDRAIKSVGGARWAPAKTIDPVAELRQEVRNTNWGDLYAEGKTITRVDVDWCGTEERCTLLRNLISFDKAANVLEIGGFCLISALSMADELPAHGRVTSLEIDPFLAAFGQKFLDKSPAGMKVRSMVGSAGDSLKALANEISPDAMTVPFDFVIIDADRASMSDYFRTIYETPGLLAKGATVCVDITPYKGQAPIRAQQTLQWMLPSGQVEVDTLCSSLRNSTEYSLRKINNLLIVNKNSKA